jgi:hypothetical protein
LAFTSIDVGSVSPLYTTAFIAGSILLAAEAKIMSEMTDRVISSLL